MKKDEARFTIWFSPADPRHKITINAIKSAVGRRTSFVVDAVCEYLSRHEGKEATAFTPVSVQLHINQTIPATDEATVTKNFTFRFSPVDPRHRIVIGVLNKAGRRKATLIADAVCEYLALCGDSNVAYIPQSPVYIVKSEQTSQPAESKPMPEIMASETPMLPTKAVNEVLREHVLTSEEAVADNISIADAVEDSGASADDSSNDSPFDDEMMEAVLGGLNVFLSNN